MLYSRRATVRCPRFPTSPRSAIGQPPGDAPLIDLTGPVHFGRDGVHSPRSPSSGRVPSPEPSYSFVAASRSEPRCTVVSFESSHKTSPANSSSASSQLTTPLQESAERSVVSGGSGSSGPPETAATSGEDQPAPPVPRMMIALGFFCLVSASAIAMTLLVQGTLARRMPGDEGHEGTGTDPPLRIETGPKLAGDSAGLVVQFERHRTAQASKISTPKQPPFLIVTLRPRTTTTSTEWPLTWPPFPETHPPWEEDESEEKKTSSEASSSEAASSEASSDGVAVSGDPSTSAAPVVLEQQQLTDAADVTTLDSTH